MALKEILDKIQANLPADAGAELTSLLADAKREANTVLADLSAANNESKGRREKLAEMGSEIETLKAKLADATKPNAELDSIKEKAIKYDELLQSKKTETLNLWKAKHQELQKILSSDTDKRKDKIAALMPDFSIPAEGEELDADTAAQNLKLYSVLEKAGAFADPADTKTDFQRKSNPGGGETKEPYTFGKALQKKT